MTISGNEQKEFINARDRRGRLVVTAEAAENYLTTHPVVATTNGQQIPVDSLGLILPGRSVPVGEPPSQAELSAALRWAERRIQPTKRPNIQAAKLRHACQYWAGFHIANGAMLAALGQLNFPMRLPLGTLGEPLSCYAGIQKTPYRRLPEVVAMPEARA